MQSNMIVILYIACSCLHFFSRQNNQNSLICSPVQEYIRMWMHLKGFIIKHILHEREKSTDIFT